MANDTFCPSTPAEFLAMGRAGAAYLAVFGLANILFYCSVLATLLRHRKVFENPFHKFMIALGALDLFILLHINIYTPICVIVQKRVLGRHFDIFLSSLSYVANYASHEFQILYAINRFCAVVFYSNYKKIFSKLNSGLMITYCYAFGLISVAATIPFGYAQTDFKWGGPFFSFAFDPNSPLTGANWTLYYEGPILTLPVLLAQFLYPIAFLFIRKHSHFLSIVNLPRLRVEMKLLMIGVVQGLVFTSGYFSFFVFLCKVPGWVHYHMWEGYVVISPYLYLIFDGILRQYWVKDWLPCFKAAVDVIEV